MREKKWLISAIVSFFIVATVYVCISLQEWGEIWFEAKDILPLVAAFVFITLCIRVIISACVHIKLNAKNIEIEQEVRAKAEADAYNKMTNAQRAELKQLQSKIRENNVPVEMSNNTPRCPKCGSTSISANQKGFGVGKAVVGTAIAGPIGLVGGNLGAKKVRVTCLNCGHHWMAGKAK